jgi:LPS sulfotransferase NodH
MSTLSARLWTPARRKRVLDLGFAGHRRYAPFVILGRSRVGSNLLRGLLNAHPAVIAYGEVFRRVGDMDWDHTGYFQSAGMRALVDRDPIRFLDRHLFGRYPVSASAVGFKLFYYHARTGHHDAVWPYLAGRTDVRVIHLKRRNVLQTHLSRKRAAMTNQWVNTSGRPETPLIVELDYQECLDDFEQTRRWEEEADRQFSGHRLLQVSYEGLAADYQAEARRIQVFLDLVPHPVAPSTFQQARQPLHATVTNYADLKARFARTPWEGFFMD